MITHEEDDDGWGDVEYEEEDLQLLDMSTLK